MNAKSYSSQARGLGTNFAELHALFNLKGGDAAQRRARTVFECVRQAECEIAREYGMDLKELDVLDVGPGQMLGHLACFARVNRAIGIDTDVIVQGPNPLHYLAMLRFNGCRRVIKTLGRKLTGFDRRFRSELMRQARLDSWPRLNVLRMDAANMAFAQGSFDFVYSFEVFEHILNPAEALDEIVRVLRPGGIAYLSFQLFTGASGALDYAGSSKVQGEPAWWSHLRSQLNSAVDFQSALGKFRLRQWRELFDAKFPGVKLRLCRTPIPEIEAFADRLHERGELLDYSMEELLTDGVHVMWKKG